MFLFIIDQQEYLINLLLKKAGNFISFAVMTRACNTVGFKVWNYIIDMTNSANVDNDYTNQIVLINTFNKTHQNNNENWEKKMQQKTFNKLKYFIFTYQNFTPLIKISTHHSSIVGWRGKKL